MPVTLFQNDGKAFTNVTAAYGLEDEKGWWFSIEAADMDKDGDMDLIAGNFGTNSYYNGTDKEPFEIYYYDFDNNGLKDIVFTYYENGKKYPFTRMKDAAVQLPAINDKFKTYTSYAKADIYEIYGKENLDRALHYQANFFKSVYLENTGNEHFVIHPLPIEAQFSSVNDILVDDYNQDGNLDILLAGNMYGLEVKTARNDAGIGLFLAGDGTGNFKSWNYMDSGFFLPYDVKSLLQMKVDNTYYVFSACNGDSLQVFKVNRLNGISHY
jgi:hypothetical protein